MTEGVAWVAASAEAIGEIGAFAKWVQPFADSLLVEVEPTVAHYAGLVEEVLAVGIGGAEDLACVLG